MKKLFFVVVCGSCLLLSSCDDNATTSTTSPSTETEKMSGQSGVQDDVSQKTVVQVAIGSKDHSTLVTAVKAAELVDVLSNTGPFTVFAPTNGAFDKLPAGTVEGLLKTDKKETLTDILQYHVSVGVYKPEAFKDGQIIGQVNGSNIIVHVKDGKVSINDGATIVASIPASNGIIHVIDGVLLPPATKN
ncbi:MAG: fasciclin [Bacteroidetes bacterium 24-39-8]|nr:MAG: fasciclin [Sphingobacteriia bacterium 35-40-5]OYZ51693.1 MAG: fasciclin [Bacteroidetes bacterium 24-39-8]HQR94578.1 fasciclin domain-containing protein [Sediminibacterium sp.]HQS55098.1 fasciclin domain-containing protein [Sediminibacterium sp.]